ncbi:MAG: copper homeostasis protein CutC [Planctomycetota bacterium]
MSVLLEVCVDSFASVKAARAGGADRLEVCGPLATGGTTPSRGFVEYCVEASGLPVMLMIRPHNGDFHYDDDDVAIMRRDITIAKEIGVTGVVFGALRKDGAIDEAVCESLLNAAGDLQTTFHRAFDVTPQPLDAFEQIQRLGFSRVLTSGQQASAIDGSALLRELVKRSSKTRVLAGAGIGASNVRRLVEETGLSEVHASASRAVTDAKPTDNAVSFGEGRRVTDPDLVRSLKAELARICH